MSLPPRLHAFTDKPFKPPVVARAGLYEASSTSETRMSTKAMEPRRSRFPIRRRTAHGRGAWVRASRKRPGSMVRLDLDARAIALGKPPPP